MERLMRDYFRSLVIQVALWRSKREVRRIIKRQDRMITDDKEEVGLYLISVAKTERRIGR